MLMGERYQYFVSLLTMADGFGNTGDSGESIILSVYSVLLSFIFLFFRKDFSQWPRAFA